MLAVLQLLLQGGWLGRQFVCNASVANSLMCTYHQISACLYVSVSLTGLTTCMVTGTWWCACQSSSRSQSQHTRERQVVRWRPAADASISALSRLLAGHSCRGGPWTCSLQSAALARLADRWGLLLLLCRLVPHKHCHWLSLKKPQAGFSVSHVLQHFV